MRFAETRWGADRRFPLWAPRGREPGAVDLVRRAAAVRVSRAAGAGRENPMMTWGRRQPQRMPELAPQAGEEERDEDDTSRAAHGARLSGRRCASGHHGGRDRPLRP